VQSILPAPSGSPWRAVKLDAGNVLVTTATVLQSASILPPFRESAFLLRLNARHESDVLLILNHLRCCTADAERQQEADAIAAFLRDSKAGKGAIPLQDGTPIILVGDFNLVGDRRQLTTLLTGDIQDNLRFGIDAAPGWNNQPLRSLPLRHLRSLFNYTWYDSTSSFASSKLDYMFYTHEQVGVEKAFVFDAFELSPDERIRYGLDTDESVKASDHFPCVLDFYLNSPATGMKDLPSGEPLPAIYPNPVSSVLTIESSRMRGHSATVTLSDLLGRQVAEIAGETGNSGKFQALVPMSGLRDGIYFVTIIMDDGGFEYRRIIKRAIR
jgi:hypothetical protein